MEEVHLWALQPAKEMGSQHWATILKAWWLIIKTATKHYSRSFTISLKIQREKVNKVLRTRNSILVETKWVTQVKATWIIINLCQCLEAIQAIRKLKFKRWWLKIHHFTRTYQRTKLWLRKNKWMTSTTRSLRKFQIQTSLRSQVTAPLHN